VRSSRRPPRLELLIVGLGYYVYSQVANRAPRTGRWRSPGPELRRLEARAHVGIEHALNTWWALTT